MRGLIFGFAQGDIQRAGRSERSLTSCGVTLEDAPALAVEELTVRLRETAQPLLLLRAGAWLMRGEPLAPILSSATGRALVGLGAARQRPAREGWRGAVADAWSRWLNSCGGDPQSGERRLPGADFFGPRFPDVVSCYLEVDAARMLGAFLGKGEGFQAAVRRLTRDRQIRTVHLSELDAHMDSACRALQVVTTIQIGGAERVTLDLAEELEGQGLRVCVAALAAPTRLAFPAPAIFEDLSAAPRDPPGRAQAIADLALEFGADLVHAHLIRAEEAREIKAQGLPLVMTIHNSLPGWPAGMSEIREGDADFLFACAQVVERELSERVSGIPVRTVWNGIATRPFAEAASRREAGVAWRKSRGWNGDDFIMVAVANPRPQKQLHRLPSILRELQGLLPGRNVRLVIVGAHLEGSVEARAAVAETEAEVERCAARDQVHWTGGTRDVADVLAASDVLVSASAYEGLSLAQLEALAAGLPVVATAVGGAPEIGRQSPAMRLVAPTATAREFAEEIARTVWKGRENGEAPELPPSFHRYQMAARVRRLYPRVIERARGLGKGEEVWLIANNFSTGGAQSSARRLLAGLAAKGVKVRAFTVQELPNHPTPGRTFLHQAGVPVVAIPPPETLDAADAAERILDLAARIRPRAVLFWNLIASYKIFLADGWTDTPIYDVSPGGMYFTSLEKYFAQPRPGMPYTDFREYGARLAGVVVKYAAETGAAAALGAPVRIIRNGVAVSEARPGRAVGKDSRLVIGTAARISPDKRLEDLIEAFSLAHSQMPRCVLRIAGGVERGAENYARELRRRSRGLPIEWLGNLSEVRRFHSTLDIFAMISEPAGCPNASLEAMAAALPVMATDVGGASEQVLDGRTGRLVRRGDAECFAEALVELARDAALRERMGAAGHAHVREQFSLERMIDEYQRLLLGEPPPMSAPEIVAQKTSRDLFAGAAEWPAVTDREAGNGGSVPGVRFFENGP